MKRLPKTTRYVMGEHTDELLKELTKVLRTFKLHLQVHDLQDDQYHITLGPQKVTTRQLRATLDY